MRVLLLLIAALCAGGVYAAEPDSAGPTPASAQPRYSYPHEERVITSPITDRFAMRGTFFPGVPGPPRRPAAVPAARPARPAAESCA